MKYWSVRVIHEGAGINELALVPGSQIHVAISRAIQKHYDASKMIREGIIVRALLFAEAKDDEELLKSHGEDLRGLILR